MARVVVLLGPPGSGKSSVGVALERRGLRWRDWERVIVRRWGSRENFVVRKQEALPLLHEEMLEWIDGDGAMAVLETTGLSDAAFLDRLRNETDTFVVRLDVSEDEGLRRVAKREPGRHLSDDAETNRAVWMAFYRDVAPRRDTDLVIDTDQMSAASVAAEISTALGL